MKYRIEATPKEAELAGALSAMSKVLELLQRRIDEHAIVGDAEAFAADVVAVVESREGRIARRWANKLLDAHFGVDRRR